MKLSIFLLPIWLAQINFLLYLFTQKKYLHFICTRHLSRADAMRKCNQSQCTQSSFCKAPISYSVYVKTFKENKWFMESAHCFVLTINFIYKPEHDRRGVFIFCVCIRSERSEMWSSTSINDRFFFHCRLSSIQKPKSIQVVFMRESD